MDYIVIPTFDIGGVPLDIICLPVNTDEEITWAKAAMREAGLSSAKVYRGGDQDAISTGIVLWAY